MGHVAWQDYVNHMLVPIAPLLACIEGAIVRCRDLSIYGITALFQLIALSMQTLKSRR